jgi:uncharacterized membrane protein YecN with MAPEG domain
MSSNGSIHFSHTMRVIQALVLVLALVVVRTRARTQDKSHKTGSDNIVRMCRIYWTHNFRLIQALVLVLAVVSVLALVLVVRSRTGTQDKRHNNDS